MVGNQQHALASRESCSTVVDFIVEHLAPNGVGVDGADIEAPYEAAHFRADITAIPAKNEFSAATVAATSCGGWLNTVPGLGELPDTMKVALAADSPSVVSVECAADEIPPFAPFLARAAPKTTPVSNLPIPKESYANAVART